MTIEWRPIPGFENYEISDQDVIRRLTKTKKFPAGIEKAPKAIG
jgi:hypothetical protein